MGHCLACLLGLCTLATWAQPAPITESFTFSLYPWIAVKAEGRFCCRISEETSVTPQHFHLPASNCRLRRQVRFVITSHHLSLAIRRLALCVFFITPHNRNANQLLRDDEVVAWTPKMLHVFVAAINISNVSCLTEPIQKAFMGSFFRLSGSLSRPCFHTNEFHHA